MVDVAQLVEHQIVALRAVGSSPTIHPKKITNFLAIIKKNLRLINVIRGVAQLVAHSLWERGVVGSSLATPTSFKNSLISLIYLFHQRILAKLYLSVLSHPFYATLEF